MLWHDVLWQGKKDVFEKLKDHNKKYIQESGIDTLITSCGECYRTFSKDYDLGIKVVHTSELLDKLGLKINADVTYHDPCRLGGTWECMMPHEKHFLQMV